MTPDTFVTITENSEFMGSNIKNRKKERQKTPHLQKKDGYKNPSFPFFYDTVAAHSSFADVFSMITAQFRLLFCRNEQKIPYHTVDKPLNILHEEMRQCFPFLPDQSVQQKNR